MSLRYAWSSGLDICRHRKVPHCASTVSETSCGRWLTTHSPTPYFRPALAMCSIVRLDSLKRECGSRGMYWLASSHTSQIGNSRHFGFQKLNSNARRPISAVTVGATSKGTALRFKTVTLAFGSPRPTKSFIRSTSDSVEVRSFGLSMKS